MYGQYHYLIGAFLRLNKFYAAIDFFIPIKLKKAKYK
jgi:hypothetical protein